MRKPVATFLFNPTFMTENVFEYVPSNLLFKAHQIQKLIVSRLVLQLSLPNQVRCLVKSEDVVGAAPTDNAPTTSG